jgi:hypothetical protein
VCTRAPGPGGGQRLSLEREAGPVKQLRRSVEQEVEGAGCREVAGCRDRVGAGCRDRDMEPPWGGGRGAFSRPHDLEASIDRQGMKAWVPTWPCLPWGRATAARSGQPAGPWPPPRPPPGTPPPSPRSRQAHRPPTGAPGQPGRPWTSGFTLGLVTGW